MMGIPPREDLAAQQANGANDAYCSRVQAESTLDYASQLSGLKSIIPGCTPISQKTRQKIQL